MTFETAFFFLYDDKVFFLVGGVFCLFEPRFITSHSTDFYPSSPVKQLNTFVDVVEGRFFFNFRNIELYAR